MFFLAWAAISAQVLCHDSILKSATHYLLLFRNEIVLTFRNNIKEEKVVS